MLETSPPDYDLARILPKVSHLAERQALAQWLAQFNAIMERRDAALELLETEFRQARTALRIRQLTEMEAMCAPHEEKIKAAQAPFDAELAAIPDDDVSKEYRMHDDWTGCDRCTITGLPLRDDDQVLDWDDGSALVEAVEAALAK